MYTREEICGSCGERFLSRTIRIENQNDANLFKQICPSCRTLKRKREESEYEQKERVARKRKAEANHKEFIERLKTWNIVSIDDVCPSDKTLYILGNGFDLMHRVSSSYYDFRDSMGKNNPLRRMLESYITVEDIWADLENSLAHFDVSAMTNEYGLDTLLDIYGAYKDDSGAAEHAMTVETAANPIITVVNELPSRFRNWVTTLKIGTADRPLCRQFINGKVLNFNYTEFVELLYGVSKDNVCYIHGCRVEQRGEPNEPLILGHVLGASDESFDLKKREKNKLRGYRRALVEITQSQVIDCITEYDEYLTKDTKRIIEKHETFFSGISSIKTIIAIGHSFSKTDWDYFHKIQSSINNIQNVKWYFGCYGLRDLDNLEKLLHKLNIDKSDITVFRTDTITTTPLLISKNIGAEKRAAMKTLCKSKDGQWIVERIENNLYISNTTDDSVDYSVVIPNGFKRAFFVNNDSCLFVVMYGTEPGVLLLRKVDNYWKFIGELSCDHQHLLVSRLKHVFITEKDITFVYNNRIRKYSLIDGMQICNDKITGAPNNHYDGDDISNMF